MENGAGFLFAYQAFFCFSSNMAKAPPSAPRAARSSLPEVERAAARKVATLRREAGLTLAELGAKSGFSAAYLSRVERGEVALSLAGLARLAEVFAVPAASFLDEGGVQPPYVLCRAGEGKRLWLRGRDGIRVSLLADAKKSKLLEPLLVEVESAGRRQPVVGHPGQEFVHVISGRCTYVLGDERLQLEAGDSLYFDARIPHAALPDSGERCRLLSVVASEDYRFHGEIARFLDQAPAAAKKPRARAGKA